jgi:alkanesulfonate monooxygenase SsuD/methylene tetrahydromethanopterin reductase-like flavin-dependent oxidoreductase (luciferase family)
VSTARDSFGLGGARSVGVVLHDAMGRVTVVSQAAKQLLAGHGADILVGRTLFDQHTVRPHGSSLEVPEPAVLALQTGRTQAPVLLGVASSNGGVRWFKVSAEPLFRVADTIPYAAVTRLELVRGLPTGR